MVGDRDLVTIEHL